MSKTLIVYETLFGSTKQAANIIEKVLKDEYNIDVDTYNLNKGEECPELDQYENIVIGSCIYQGKWAKNAETFLNNEFDGKKLALYVCSGFAGEPDLYLQAYRSYLEDIINNHPKTDPISMEAFGGRVPENRYPEIWSMQVKGIMPKFQRDNRSTGRVEVWARELGQLFTEN